MRRHTILATTRRDPSALRLSSAEAFLLSLVDGYLTLGEIADIAGMTLAQMFPHADRLLEVGAVRITDRTRANRPAEPPPSLRAPAGPRSTRTPVSARAPRITAPPPSARGSRPSRSPPSARAPRTRTPPSLRAPRSAEEGSLLERTTRAPPSKRRITNAPGERASRRPSARGSSAPIAPSEAPSSLDPELHARVLAMDAALPGQDHYAALGLDRSADKRAVKRAYFALAAQFHPDRFFGQRLGASGPVIQRIFTRLTVAHDTLVDRALRAAYDATLSPATLPPAPTPSTPSRRPSKRSSAKMKAVAPLAAQPASRPLPAPRSLAERQRERDLLRARLAHVQPPPRSPPPAVPDDTLRRLYSSKKHAERQRRIAVFVAAAEEAMRRDNVVAAASNYRLALQNCDDPEIRAKLDTIEERAQRELYEASVTRARSAEKNERWGEAAIFFMRANAVRAEAATAERAAHSLRMDGGDLHRAMRLAEQAVQAEPENAAFHVTLGEICLAANLVARAETEAQRALALAPNDPRALALAHKKRR